MNDEPPPPPAPPKKRGLLPGPMMGPSGEHGKTFKGSAKIILATAKQFLGKRVPNGVVDDLASKLLLKLRAKWLEKNNDDFLRGKPLTRSYLYRMAERFATTYRKAEMNGMETSIEDIPDYEDLFEASETADTAQRMGDALAVVRTVVEAMPPKRRMVFLLRHDKGMEDDQIAEALDVKESVVRQHRSKGFEDLHKACVAAGMPELFAVEAGRARRERQVRAGISREKNND